MDKTTIYLQPTKAFKRRLLANHLMPGIVLLLNGIDSLLGGEKKNTFLIFLNFLAGGLLFIAVIIEMRKAGTVEHRVVGWVEVFAGLVLMVEGANHFHPGKGFQPAVAYWLGALVTVLLGIFHTKISRFRRAVLEESGFLIRTSPIRKLKMKWGEMDAINFENSEMHVSSRDGRESKISLGQVLNIEEVKAGFQEWLDRKREKEIAPSADYGAKDQ